MDLFDNAVNRRFMSGSFPSEKLYPVSGDDCLEIDFEKEAAEALSLFKEHPEVFNFFFLSCRDRVKELDKLQIPELYTQEVNCYINTKHSPASLNVMGVILDAYNLCPVVTPLDKILWMGAHLYSFEEEFVRTEREYDPHKMMLAWVFLLLAVQENEQKTGKTIDVDSVTFESNLIDCILCNWESDTQEKVIPLSKQQVQSFSILNDKKNILLKKLLEEKEKSREIAERTNEEWLLFLKIVNDLSEKESDAIAGILDDVSISEKKRIISEYRSVLRGIEKAKYNLDGSELNLLEVLGAVKERMTDASYFASARVQDGEPFRVHPAAFGLVIQPNTYNYLLMSFHEFRLSPSKETAKQFVALALSCLKTNLGQEDKQLISVDDMVEDFASTIFEFVDNNAEIIKSLSYSKVQVDAINVDGSSRIAHETDLYSDELTRTLERIQGSEEYDREIEAIIEGHGHILSEEELSEQLKTQERVSAMMEDKALAQQLIYSLNIIYLFSDALRIMLNNKRAHVKIKKRDKAEQYRRRLLDLDAELVYLVYSGLGEKEISMREYREQTGVISSYLSEREYQEELFRSTVCFDVMKDAISDLISHIEEQSTDSIIETKSRIKEQIRMIPDFENKEMYTGWIDSVSTRICSALIDNCRNRGEEYSEVKSTILKSLGEKSDRLPTSTIDSLTTAEMLFGNYATDDFAEKGFDFSCISALYYQAFEDAYNELIWKGYAERLNHLIIGDKPYTTILKKYSRKDLTEPDHIGYLHKDSYQRNHYVQFPSKEKGITTTSVSLRCMYKSFAILMKSVDPHSALDKYCDYFAEITGYESADAMFNDVSFMNKCEEFTKAISDSADNRNNASHGGTFIDKEQCAADKKTVLNDLESVRSSSIGLIQQLLYILYKE